MTTQHVRRTSFIQKLLNRHIKFWLIGDIFYGYMMSRLSYFGWTRRTQHLPQQLAAGENTVMYLFMRYKFKWFEEKYSYYAAYKMITVFFGTLFSVTVLSHRLKMHDAIIGCIACIFDILAAVCYVFANEPWQMYVIPLVDFFHGTALTVSTSLTTKLVEKDEIGRTNSVQGVFNTLFLLFVIPLYSTVYRLTFEYLAGAVFLLNIGITISVLTVFVVIYWKCKYLWIKETTQCNS